MYFNLKKISRVLIFTLILLFLNACGFHLKGYSNSIRSEANKQLMQKLYIQYTDKTIPYSFKNQLRLDLRSNNITTVNSRKTATAILKITSYNKVNQPITLIGSYSAGTYSAELSVSYLVVDSNNNILQESIKMKASENYNYNGAQQLSSNQEQDNAFSTVMKRISNNIALQLQSIQPSPATILPQESN